MQSYWQSISSFEGLYRGYLAARKGKRKRRDVIAFELDLETSLLAIKDQLVSESWVPGEYRQFTIYDRKPRKICAAPFADRVVHHALMDTVMPVFEQQLTSSCYACRRGKGVHQAIRRYQRGAKRYRYALKLDIAAYFPSIDHGVLKQQLQVLFEEQRVLQLFNRIIASAPVQASRVFWPGADLVDIMRTRAGLPIGNLSSQHFGNLYLACVDRFVRDQLNIPVYLRYVDDLILLDDCKDKLWYSLQQLEQVLAELHLKIHPRKVHLAPTKSGVEVLGYVVYPHKIRLRRDNGYRFRRRLIAMKHRYDRDLLSEKDIAQSIAAWRGHCLHADSESLQQNIVNSVHFATGGTSSVESARVARRRLEQQTREPAVRQPKQEQPG